MKQKHNARFIDGFSESTWKSMVVKSVRIGWIQGILEAEKRLAKSTFQNLLIAGLFEDIFPAGYDALKTAAQYIKERKYEALLAMETHHGRGLTQKFFDMAKESCDNAAKDGPRIAVMVKRSAPELGFIIPRVYNCLYTWYYVMPKDTAKKRTILDHKFTGIPYPILDGHTYEGKRMGVNGTMLSGSYEQHLNIGNQVSADNGWTAIREKFINQPVKPITQQALF